MQPEIEQRPRRRNRVLNLVGIAIGLVGVAFAVFTLVNGWDEIARADLRVGILATAGVVGLAGMTTIGLNWVRIIRVTGGRARSTSGLRWYFVGQLGKYIPGGLWAVLGRGELATRGGIGRNVSYTSVGVSLVTTYAAAATTGAVFLAFGSSSLTARFAWLSLSASVVVAGTFGLGESVVRRVNRIANRFGIASRLPATRPRSALSAIVMTVPAWLAIGAATALVSGALGFPVETTQIIAATSYSWLAGFLVVPVPGGLGVREATFVGLYPGPTQEAAAIAVIARMVFVLVDLTGAAVSTAASHRRATSKVT
jgi:glycosyltransferase 2 family protein